MIGVLLSLRSVEILQPQQVAAAFHGPVPGIGEERFGSLGKEERQRALRGIVTQARAVVFLDARFVLYRDRQFVQFMWGDILTVFPFHG